MKSNGRDKSNLTLNEDENKHFIEKADQDYDAIKTTGKYSWLELVTGQINKKLKKISVTIIATPTIAYIKLKHSFSHSKFIKLFAKYI